MANKSIAELAKLASQSVRIKRDDATKKKTSKKTSKKTAKKTVKKRTKKSAPKRTAKACRTAGQDRLSEAAQTIAHTRELLMIADAKPAAPKKKIRRI